VRCRGRAQSRHRQSRQPAREMGHALVLVGLASPGPLGYDTIGLADARGTNTLRTAAARRPAPLFGPPRKPSVAQGRYREDESRFVSHRMARGNSPGQLGPGPATFMLPSTFICAAPAPLHTRARIQVFQPRSNSQADLAQLSHTRPTLSRPQSASRLPRTPSDQIVVIGSERRRSRPSSAMSVRRYSNYAFEHDVVPPTFRDTPTFRDGLRAASDATLSGESGGSVVFDGNSALASSTSAASTRRPRSRPQSAAPTLQWTASVSRHAGVSTGARFGPPGLTPPFRSAFVQPFGLNKFGQ
jgi:hypothetical protein